MHGDMNLVKVDEENHSNACSAEDFADSSLKVYAGIAI